MSGRPFLDGWVSAVVSERGPDRPLTRLVLLVLAQAMDESGETKDATSRSLQTQTGLSRRCLLVHLRKAEADGWLRRTRLGAGRSWARHVYKALIPDDRGN